MKRFPLITSSMVFIAMLSFFVPECAALFIFDREAILQGQLWRLLSSHSVHFTREHLIYNLITFVTVAWIIERKSALELLFLYLFSAFIIAITLLFYDPSMLYYGGTSGIVCALIVYCALVYISDKHWTLFCCWILFVLLLKIAIELYSHASVLPHAQQQLFIMMPISHLMGAVSAIFYYPLVNRINTARVNR